MFVNMSGVNQGATPMMITTLNADPTNPDDCCCDEGCCGSGGGTTCC